MLFLKNYIEVKGENIEVYKEVHEDLVYMPVLLGVVAWTLYSFHLMQYNLLIHQIKKKNKKKTPSTTFHREPLVTHVPKF